MKSLILILILVLSQKAISSNETSLKRWSAYATYSPLDTWTPNKFGVVASYGDKSRLYELAFQKATISAEFENINLSSWSDTRIHLTTRSHTFGNSFNFQYGVFYNALNLTIGDESFGGVSSSVNVLELKTLGFAFGVGNSWQWNDRFNLRIDWFKLFIPLYTLGREDAFLSSSESSSSKQIVDGALDLLEDLPTGTLGHVEIGYSF
jgi:hypothetical protein